MTTAPPPFVSAKEARAALQAEAIKAARAELLARAAKSGPNSDDDLAAAQARATAIATPPSEKFQRPEALLPVDAKMPLAMQVATGKITTVPKVTIHEEDFEKCFTGRKLDHTAQWWAAVRELAKQRVKGDVLEPTIMAVAGKLVRYVREGRGVGRAVYALIAADVGCSFETVRKVLRWLESKKSLVTAHVMVRVGKRLWRGANAYFLKLPTEGEPAPDDAADPAGVADAARMVLGAADEPAAEVLKPLRRLHAHLGWIAPFFKGLVVRSTGLNTTGMRLARPPPA